MDLCARAAAPAEGDAAAERSIVRLLQRRGVLGLDEVGFALRALLEAHLLDGSLPFLETADHRRLARTLDQRLCLSCLGPSCALPQGLAVVRVPPARCEQCGGLDAYRSYSLFSDACLLAGITRVAIIGGRRWLAAWMAQGIDQRVSVRSWPSRKALDREPLSQDLDWAQLAVVWDDGRLADWLTPEAAEPKPGATVRCAGRSAGAALSSVAEAIGRIDPRALSAP